MKLGPHDGISALRRKDTTELACWHPELGLVASRTVRNICLLFKHPLLTPSVVFCYGSLNLLVNSLSVWCLCFSHLSF